MKRCPRCSVGELGEFVLSINGETKVVMQCDECGSQVYDPSTQGIIEKYVPEDEEFEED